MSDSQNENGMAGFEENLEAANAVEDAVEKEVADKLA